MQERHPSPRISGLNPTWRLVFLVLFIAIATVVVILVPIPPVEQLRAIMDRAGWWGPAAFIAGYAALTLAPVPKNVLAIAAGILFGFAVALIIVFSAAMIGAATAFWLGRALGRDAVEKFTGTRV